MFERYAIYYTFDGALGAAGAQWLGWDIARGAVLAPTRDVTQRPRKYGFHATIKAPFHLTPSESETDLKAAFAHLCGALSPVTLDGLEQQNIGRFCALTIKGQDGAIKHLAATTVRALDRFRAPLSNEDRTRRLKARLSPEQIENVHKWGYPHVMEQFQFHVTLTGPLKAAQADDIQRALARIFTPLLPRPFEIAHLTLAGQRADGFFEQILRLPLTGAGPS